MNLRVTIEGISSHRHSFADLKMTDNPEDITPIYVSAALAAGHSNNTREPGADSIDHQSTISLISSILDVKLKDSVTKLKRSLSEKDFETQREIKKMRSESKASNSFKYKSNRLRYEFNVKVLDQLNAAKKKLVEGRLYEVSEEINLSIQEITKRNKLVRFADKNQCGWAAVDEYQSDELAEDSEDDKKLRAAEKRALAKIKATKSAKYKKFFDRHQRPHYADQGTARPPNLGFQPNPNPNPKYREGAIMTQANKRDTPPCTYCVLLLS